MRGLYRINDDAKFRAESLGRESLTGKNGDGLGGDQAVACECNDPGNLTEGVIVQSSKIDLRTDAAECMLFFFVSSFAWSEVAIVVSLFFGIRPTLRGYLLAIGCFSICWSLGYLPFQSIWEKLRQKERAIHADTNRSTENSIASMMSLKEQEPENHRDLEMGTELIGQASSD